MFKALFVHIARVVPVDLSITTLNFDRCRRAAEASKTRFRCLLHVRGISTGLLQFFYRRRSHEPKIVNPCTQICMRLSTTTINGTCIKAVLSDDEGMGQKAHRNPACIMPRCTGEDH